MRENNYFIGKTIYALGVFFYTINDTVMKWLAPNFPIEKIIFYRSLIALVVVILIQLSIKKTSAFKIDNFFVMFCRCIFSFLTLYFSLRSLTGLDLSSFNMYYHLAPIIIILLSPLFLKEPITKNLLLVLIIGSAGVVISFHPGIGSFNIYKGYVLIATLSWALSMILLKLLSNKDSSISILLYSAFFNVVVCAPFMEEFSLDPYDLFPFAILSVVHLLAFYIIIEVLKRAPLIHVAPLEYTGILWALPISYFFWDEIPDFWMVMGGTLIIIGSMYSLYMKKKSFQMGE